MFRLDLKTRLPYALDSLSQLLLLLLLLQLHGVSPLESLIEGQIFAVVKVGVSDIGKTVLFEGSLQVDGVVGAEQDLVGGPMEQVLAL